MAEDKKSEKRLSARPDASEKSPLPSRAIDNTDFDCDSECKDPGAKEASLVVRYC